MKQEQENQPKQKKQLKTKTQNKVFARKNVFNRFKDYQVNFDVILNEFDFDENLSDNILDSDQDEHQGF